MRPAGPSTGPQVPIQPSRVATATATTTPRPQRDADSAEITVELDCGVFDCSDADINRFLDDLQDYLGSATVSFVSIRDNMLRVLICDSTSLPELETALRQRDSAQVEFQNFDSLVRFVYGVPCGGDYSVSYIFDSPSAASVVTLPITLMMVLLGAILM